MIKCHLWQHKVFGGNDIFVFKILVLKWQTSSDTVYDVF